jgi:hypothetical protein
VVPLNPKNIDPRMMARAAEYIGSHPSDIPLVQPGRGPVAMPMAMPGPPGPGGYNRYREMTL